MTSEPHSLPDNPAQAVEGGFLFDDWNLPEQKNPAENPALFDGKIIARMPDLGSEEITKNSEKNHFLSLGSRLFLCVSSVFQRNPVESLNVTINPRQRFFRRVTVCGGAVLLCGLGIFLLEQNQNEPVENPLAMTEILSESPITPATEHAAVIGIMDSAFSPGVIPNPTGIVTDLAPNSAVPAADLTAVPSPAADAYSPWNITSKQPESPPPPSDVVVVDAAPSDTVAMSQMTPIESPSMMDTTSMPISPYERHLVAQSSATSNRPVPSYNPSPNPSPMPGMMPTHDRLVNAPGMPATQNVQPQYYPQGGSPANVPAGSSTHGQYGQYAPYAAAAPPNYAPPGMPIPSGVSTLPTQRGGYYQQQPPYGAPMPTPPNDFYGAPPIYRRY